MKRRLLLFFILFSSLVTAQNNIYRSGGITQTVGAPTFTPGASGNIVAIDTVTGEWYVNPNRLSGASWISAGYRLTNISGSVPPAYTPTAHQSHFVVNAANQLYYWNGSSWQSVGGGGGGSTDALRLKFIVINKSGSTINKGQVVYVSGAQGNRVAVKKALASVDSLSANTLGVMDETVANNGEGYCVAEGLVSGINTSAFTEGAALYLSPTTAGGITQTKTTAPDHLVLVGYCVKSNAGSGEISVHIQNGYELDELHDVYLPAPTNGQVLTYNTTNKRWEAATVADQSATNEGIVGVSAGSATTSVITSNTSGANGVTVSAGTGISLSETTSTNGGTITVTNSAPDQTVSITNGGGVGVTGSYPSFTLTATDQSVTNEIQRLDTFSLSGQTLRASLLNDGVAASSITLPVTNVTAGTGISVSSATGNYTVTNSAPDQTVSISNGGGVGVTGSYPSFTLTAADQSITNEIQRIDTLSLSGQTLRASLLNDGVAASSVTLPIVDVVAGTNVTVTKSNGVATVSATGGGAPTGSAGGDLSGTYPNPTVAAIQGRSVSSTAPSANQVLAWNSGTSAWTPTAVAGTGTVTGTGTATRVAFWDGTSSISSNANLFWDNTNSRLGIGTTSPTQPLSVLGAIRSQVTGANCSFTAYNPFTNYPRAVFLIGNSTSDVNVGMTVAPAFEPKPTVFNVSNYNNELNSSSQFLSLYVSATANFLTSTSNSGNNGGNPLSIGTNTILSSQAIVINTTANNQNVSIGTGAATTAARLLIQGANNTSNTYSLIVTNSGGSTTTPAICAQNDQKVGIGTNSVDSGATLEVDGTSGGILFPRLSTTNRDALIPTNGLVIYNSTTNKLQVYAGGAWVDLH